VHPGTALLAPFLLILAGPSPALLAQQGEELAPGQIEFVDYELGNGLKVILAPDPGATAVAVNLWYDVGSRHEPPGRSGFAHLFEHLMFQGSAHVEEGQHFQLLERAGGEANASITEDRTNYFQTLPPHRMNLALWLESDRMRGLRITEEAMQREVEVVKEERRRSVDNSPYGSSQLQAAYYAAYDSASCFAYAHSVIGSMEDLDAARLPEVQEFFDLHYAPNNASLAIVGAFDEAEARRLVEEYFGDIPRGESRPDPTCREPFSHLPVAVDQPDPNATLPGVWISYGTVERGHEDAAALSVLARILGDGRSSRLHQRLVRGEQAALEVAAFSSTRLDPGIFQLVAIANQGVESEDLLAFLDEEVGRVVSEGVTEAEVERARNQVRAGTVMGRQTVMGRAEALQSANHFFGTPTAVRTTLEQVEAVTPGEVQRVAATYLRPENRAVIHTRPGQQEEDR
jgi:zinc protease